MAPLRIGLGLDTREGRAGFDFARAMLPPGAVLTRSTAGSCIGPEGSVILRPPDEARFDHDPVSRARLGLLIEANATNLVTESLTIASPAWMADNGGEGSAEPVVTPGVAVAPDGSAATRIAFSRGNGFSRISTASAPVAAGAQAVFSIWLRAAVPGPSVALRCDTSNDPTLNLTPYWQRHALPIVGSGAGISCQILLWAVIEGSPATAEIEAWGAQLELGSQPSSLIPTTAAPATRAADSLVLNWASRGIADGERTIRYTFSDGGAVAVITAITGGVGSVTLPHAGARLLRAEAL